MNPTNTRRPIRVTLARESELVARGFVSMMEGYSDRIRVVGLSRPGAPTRPADLTLHDTLADIRFFPGVAAPLIPHEGKLVTWTWNARPDLVDIALRNGSSGVLGKNLPAGALVAALEAIHHGRVVVRCDTRSADPRRDDENDLTPREGDVIAMITQGLDNQTIAERAGVSINSVKSYIRSAYRKMGVSSRSQAVLWGVRHGYLEPAPLSAAAMPTQAHPAGPGAA